jgi:hypothetical protein
VVSFTTRPLYFQGKSPWYPLGRRLGGPESRSGRGGEEKHSQPLPGLEPPIVQAVDMKVKMLRKIRLTGNNGLDFAAINSVELEKTVMIQVC